MMKRMKANKSFRRRGVLLLSALLLVLSSWAWAPDSLAGSPAERVGRLGNDAIDEASGMAASTLGDDVLWVVNDSGGRPVLYALDTRGNLRKTVKVRGAENRDWEDLAAFRIGGRSRLLIADVGDNRRKRDSCELLIVPEPAVEKGDRKGEAQIDIERRIVFVYPDTPHDCESVAVDTAGKRILLLTKRDRPPLLYELPLEPEDEQRPLTAVLVAAVNNIPPPTNDDLLQPHGRHRSWPTAMDIDAGSRRAVVLTYKDAYVYTRRGGMSWKQAFGRPPETITLPLPEKVPGLPQRETVCFSRDGRFVFVTSEGKGAALYRFGLFP